jgi:hypothetical protein
MSDKDFKNYVCTLEQAIELEKLGVKQDDALYYWVGDGYISRNEEKPWLPPGYEYPKKLGAAFTSQELGEIVNLLLKDEDISVVQTITNSLEFQEEFDGTMFTPSEDIDREAQARAEFLIALLLRKQKSFGVKNETR